MIPCRTNLILKITTIILIMIKGSRSILTPSNTTILSGVRPIKQLEISSSLPPDAMTTHMPPVEEFPRRQEKGSRKPRKVKQYSAHFARDLVCFTPSNPPTLIAPAMM